jgi:hypothetical protein
LGFGTLFLANSSAFSLAVFSLPYGAAGVLVLLLDLLITLRLSAYYLAISFFLLAISHFSPPIFAPRPPIFDEAA